MFRIILVVRIPYWKKYGVDIFISDIITFLHTLNVVINKILFIDKYNLP